MNILAATNPAQWDTFLAHQQHRPFLQSWTMGEVYKDVGQNPLRLEVRHNNTVVGICQATLVPARRGRHLSIPYGPVLDPKHRKEALPLLIAALKEEAKKQNCSFVRLSPFWLEKEEIKGSKPSPIHLLAEHLWYIPLMESDPWTEGKEGPMRPEEEIMMEMRKTSRNLVRRATKDGVTIVRSEDPIKDLPDFIELHEVTRKRHAFTPYTNAFFEAQVRHFTQRNECTMYRAMYQGELIACSIHMHAFGETSYHHGASTHKHSKVPASYLLQWTAITDAIKRGDRVYNFWGISPEGVKNHPFAGVRTFKTGFGGRVLEVSHAMDVPVNSRYHLTRAFETLRKWRRGF
jgi:peptidoglycan pentaglycine glycine transferase (the first glycine)